MQFSLILTSLFCFTTRVNMVRATDCDCVVLSKTRVHHSKIKEYTIQDDDGNCLFGAIVFRTVGGKTICSNPKDDWANHVIQLLKKRQNPNISKDSSGSESPSGPSTAQESEQTGTPALSPGSELPSAPALVPSTPAVSSGSEQTETPALSPGSELPSAPALVPSTPATASGLEQTGTPALVPSMSSMSPGSEQTTAPTSALGSETPSTPSVAAPSGPASLSESTSEPTSAPSTETSASSTAPSSTPSSTTLNPISAKSTPNPTSAPNTTSGTSGTRSALYHILATSSTTRRASTQRRSTLSR